MLWLYRYAYLELDDEETAQKVAEQYKEVEFEGENLYCRCLRPGKPEDPEYETNPGEYYQNENLAISILSTL